MWRHPELSDAKEPAGGCAGPPGTKSLSSSELQHTTEPSVMTPQVLSSPAETDVNGPGWNVVTSLLWAFQQTAEPSVRTPQA